MSKAISYCAFLRGVNLNGRSMKMEEVRTVFAGCGLENVASLLATGNIVFQTDKPRENLRATLETAMSGYYSENVGLFIKNSAEVDAIAESTPFDENPEMHAYAFICEPGFENTLRDEFDKITSALLPGETAAVRNGIFYWQVLKGSTLDAGFSKILSQKNMKDKLTSRNINTIIKVRDKMKKI